jgi:hypothetical protein
MRLEEIAARHARLPGYKLVNYLAAALPVWIVDVVCLVIAEKKISLVDEFILRSIHSGVSSSEEIAGFLGLDQRYVIKRLGGLLAADHIHYTKTESESAIALLTVKGRKAFSEAQVEIPREEVLAYLYDGILRRVIPLGRNPNNLMRPFQVRDWGLLEVPAFPGRPPTDPEIAEQDLNSVLPRNTKKERRIRQLLSVSKIGQRRRRFQEAVLLLYKGSDDSDIQVRFFSTDGRSLPEMDAAFAKKEGISRLGIREKLKASREEIAVYVADKESAEVLRLSEAVSDSEQDKMARAAAESVQIHNRVQIAEQQLEGIRNEQENYRLKSEVDQLRRDLTEREAILKSKRSRLVEVFEHPKLFDDALKGATTRLMIVSPWMNDQALNSGRVDAISHLLSKSASVYIGYGISSEGGQQRRKGSRDEESHAFRRLQEFGKRHDNLHFVKLGDTHAKVLIKDSDFAIVGSFNWMSFAGDPLKGFREELSILTTDREAIDQLFDRYVERFGRKKSLLQSSAASAGNVFPPASH